MNISENLIRIKEGKNNIIKSLKNKGVSINDDTLINEIPTIIDNAEIGGGDTPVQPDVPELTPKYDGASVFRIVVHENDYEFAINLCNDATKATYDVDWGDGNLEYGKTTDEQHHTYSKSGIYDVNIYNISKDITLGGSTSISGSSSVTIYYLFNNSNNDYWLGNKYSYQKDNIVTNILIGDKITSIGEYVFQSCSSLQSVVIPEGVTSIGRAVFDGCSSLQSITIPEGVTSIKDNVFYKCTSLQNVVIPDSVTSIGSSVFNGCSSLQSITIPEGVTSIGSSVFNGCSSLQSVTIPNSVTSIESSVFQSCSSLQSVVIPEGVTSIGRAVFDGCSSLQSITIPEGVTSIKDNVFYKCTSLQNVVIPNSVTSIGNFVFDGCSSLQSITIPEGVTSIKDNVFNGCNYLQSITCKAMTAPTIQSNSFPTSGLRYTKRYLYVPKDSQGYDSGKWKTYLIDKGWELRYIEDYPKTQTTLKLKTINNFFHKWNYIGQANLVDYELVDNEYIYHFDDKITELVEGTFYNKVLEEIELSEGLEIISSGVFQSCSSLQSIVIPNSVTSIGNFVFNGCSSLQSITIPEGVTTIGKYAFQSCSSLQSITIPEGVTTIGEYAFQSCTKLSTITCKAMIAPTIQWNIFNNIGTSVPSGTPKVLRVPQGASGYDSGNWKSTVIDKGYTLEYIVPNTLNYTSYSGDVVTPYAKSFEGKNEIVSNVYENGIGTITFKEGLTEIYEDMYNKDVVGALTSIEIPNNITRIGNYSFRSQYLTTLNVPDSVTEIGDSAFNGCTNLTEITLGSSLETIGQWAFSGCTKVSTITCMAMVAPTLNQSFLSVGSNVSGDKILRVPEGAEGYDTWLSQLNGFTIEYIN